mgnify:CR=1 FL=1
MLNLFQNDSESGMIPFPEYFIRNLYVHRFRLSSRSADTRRRIVRWLFLHFHVYDYHPADAEIIRDATFRGNGSRPCSL